MLTEDQLGEFIDEHFRSDLFRLETRTAYSVDSDGEDYSRYLFVARQSRLRRARPDGWSTCAGSVSRG
jgi:hypothetical protein